MIKKIKEFSVSRIAAWVIIAICGLNLNGFFYMLFGEEQVFSIILLVCSIYLIIKHGANILKDNLFIWYVGSITVYIWFSAVYSLFGDVENINKYLLSYISSFLVIFAISSYISSKTFNNGFEIDRKYIEIVFLIATLTVWFSSYLFQIYMNPPPATDRFSGVFGNPNEAGIASVATLAMVIARPSRRILLQALKILCTCGAIFITFSRSSILAFMVVMILYFIYEKRRSLILNIALLAPVLLLIYQIIVMYSVKFTSSQLLRIEQIGKLLVNFEISGETTTGRTYLWDFAFNKIVSNFPFGYGFGVFHNMLGGVMENHVWQGAHNTYLMILGEAGFVAFIVVVVANLKFIFSVLRNKFDLFLLLYLFVLQIDMMSAHNVLTLRFHNVLIGMCIGVIFIYKNNKKRKLS